MARVAALVTSHVLQEASSAIVKQPTTAKSTDHLGHGKHIPTITESPFLADEMHGLVREAVLTQD